MNRFRLSKPQKQRIADTLKLRKGLSLARVLTKIEQAAPRERPRLPIELLGRE